MCSKIFHLLQADESFVFRFAKVSQNYACYVDIFFLSVESSTLHMILLFHKEQIEYRARSILTLSVNLATPKIFAFKNSPSFR